MSMRLSNFQKLSLKYIISTLAANYSTQLDIGLSALAFKAINSIYQSPLLSIGLPQVAV